MELEQLLKNTQEGVLEWYSDGFPLLFWCRTQNQIYKITCQIDENSEKVYGLSHYLEDGTKDVEEIYNVLSSSYAQVNDLFTLVMNGSPSFAKAAKNQIELLNKIAREREINVSQIDACLCKNHDSNELHILEEDKSFYIFKDSNFQYIQPPLRRLPTSSAYVSLPDAQIILISAIGATGKSALSCYLSIKHHMPILDLAEAPAVGGNTTVGTLYNKLGVGQLSIFIEGLQTGKTALIIDGLDEARTKVKQEGYEAFVAEIARLCQESKSPSIVLLGRVDIMEETALHLEEKGIKVAMCSIEPFPISQAKDFIDCNLRRKSEFKHEQSYVLLRDYILASVQDFFGEEKQQTQQMYNKFIGYAPVLQVIAKMLDGTDNYHAEYVSYKDAQKYSVDLVIDIVERILLREQKKVRDNLLPTFKQRLDEDTYNNLYATVYSIEEQCLRLMLYLINEPYKKQVIPNVSLNQEYEDNLKGLFEQHPFLDRKKSFQNIVFESYIIACLARNEEYLPIVYKYLERNSHSCSYLLLSIYDKLIGEDKNVQMDIIKYLIESFYALTSRDVDAYWEIYEQTYDEAEDNLSCELNFYYGEHMYAFHTTLPYSTLYIPSTMRNSMIDSPHLNIEGRGSLLTLLGNNAIKCNQVDLRFEEVSLGLYKEYDCSVFECKQFLFEHPQHLTPRINNYSRSSNLGLQIFTQDTLPYPFIAYQEKEVSFVSEDNQLAEKYQKLRRLLLQFRSHSKGKLARCTDKIDNRLGNTSVGRAIIKKLLDKQIMYKEGIMYYIDYENLGSILGVKYDSIRTSVIDERIKTFLEDIHVVDE